MANTGYEPYGSGAFDTPHGGAMPGMATGPVPPPGGR